MTEERIKEEIEYIIDITGEPIRECDGHENALIGYTSSFSGNDRPTRLVYDIEKILENLVINSDPQMTRDEALEYFNYNIAEAYVGPHTPVFVNKIN